MTSQPLSHDEELALIMVVEMVAASDGTVSKEEQRQVSALAETLGDARYRELCGEVDERVQDDDDVWDFLRTITRQEARERIYAAAVATAIPGTVSGGEAELLEWLEREWGVSAEPATGSDATIRITSRTTVRVQTS